MRLATTMLTLLSGSVAIAPVNTVAPVISGTQSVGSTLSCTTGTFTGTPTPTFAYQWKRAGVSIGSATNSTYLLVSADAGQAITCTVTATNAAGSASATSNSLTIISANTVAPAISATAVIGTSITGDDGTWAGSPTFTYQWQRNTGSFVNIGGATSKNYTPVDADFGYALQLVVTATNSGGNASANSNATNLTQEAPAQSLGSNIISNSAFASDTVWNKGTGWTIAAGVGSHSSGTASAIFQAVTSAIGTTNEHMMDISGLSGGTVSQRLGNNVVVRSANGTVRAILRRVDANVNDGAQCSNIFVGNIDNLTEQPITTNVQLTAPSADMQLDQYFTLPASPQAGSQIWLLPRISDFSAGNHWVAVLEYTGSQWNITLYSAAAYTLTSRISATNIGTTNGIRVNMNGTSISLYSTADGGSNWTQRGTTITNATYQTATGVNAIMTSDFTFGNTVYAAAV